MRIMVLWNKSELNLMIILVPSATAMKELNGQ
jgi:hypothetical protein